MAGPVVGCPQLAHPGAQQYAQRWFLVDEHRNWLRDQGLDAVQLSISHGHLVLRAPGMLRLDIPLDVIEDDDSVQSQVQVAGQSVLVVDEGDLAAVWFSNLLGKPCRLVKIHPDQAIPSFDLAPGD